MTKDNPNHTGEKTLVLNKVIDRYPRMLGLLKAAESRLNHTCIGRYYERGACVLCEIQALLKEIEQ